MNFEAWNSEISKLKSIFLKTLGLKIPVFQAPMAGGATTPKLVAAVSNAGGLGSFAGGYATSKQLLENIKEIKKLTDKPFSVNLFIPAKSTPSNNKYERINALLNVYRSELGISQQPLMPFLDDPFEEKISIIISEKVPVFSFTFGIPSQPILKKLKSQNIITIGTCTTVNEGLEIEKAGCDAVVGQGSDAGGHRGTFLGSFDSAYIGTMSLIPQLTSKLQIPVIAAGGIMDGRGIVASLALGASAVQMGTSFLTCSESGINQTYKNAILASTEESTVITPVFSGKPARGIKNRFIEEMKNHINDILDYPIQNYLTQDIRLKAAQLNNSELLSLWAGQGTRLNRVQNVSTLLDEIEKEIQSTIKMISLN